MENIRDEVYGFVELWNCHVIRNDNTRPNIVSGKPFMMYRRPKSGMRYGQPVDLQLCEALLQDCEIWGELPIGCLLYKLSYCVQILMSIFLKQPSIGASKHS